METMISATALYLYLCQCSILQTIPIVEDCHLSYCSRIQPAQATESHDCRSQILACAWHDAVQAVPQGTRIGKHGKSFVTVTEAVICDSAPVWWYREIRRGITGMELRVGFPCRQLKNLWHEDSNGVHFSGVDELSIQKDGLLVELHESSLLLPTAILIDQLGSTSLADAGAFALCVTEKYAVVALFCPTTGFGNPESLVCIDHNSGAVNWTGQLDQHLTEAQGSSGAPLYAYTEITQAGSMIAVYSASQEAVSLQCFNAETGVKELTFLSNRIDSYSERADE